MADYNQDFPPLSKPLAILLLGHSFIKRLAAFARGRGRGNMALDPSQGRIQYQGIGGLKLSGLLDQMDIIGSQNPDVVFPGNRY